MAARYELVSDDEHPQAQTVLTHLKATNPEGYASLQEVMHEAVAPTHCGRGGEQRFARGTVGLSPTGEYQRSHYSVTLNIASKCNITEICCVVPAGGTKCLQFTAGDYRKGWSRSLTGQYWRVDAKRLFGHMGKKMITVNKITIDFQMEGDWSSPNMQQTEPPRYMVTNISPIPEKLDLAFGKHQRPVSFAHLAAGAINNKVRNVDRLRQFVHKGEEGYSVQSSLGIHPLRREEVFSPPNKVLPLGECLKQLGDNAIFPLSSLKLQDIRDIKHHLRVPGVYPFAGFATPAARGDMLRCPVSACLKEFDDGVLLIIDESWSQDPENWEAVFEHFAEICKKTL